MKYLIILLSFICLISCKKSEQQDPREIFVGNWNGTINIYDPEDGWYDTLPNTHATRIFTLSSNNNLNCEWFNSYNDTTNPKPTIAIVKFEGNNTYIYDTLIIKSHGLILKYIGTGILRSDGYIYENGNGIRIDYYYGDTTKFIWSAKVYKLK